jgi:hypothetical protein
VAPHSLHHYISLFPLAPEEPPASVTVDQFALQSKFLNQNEDGVPSMQELQLDLAITHALIWQLEWDLQFSPDRPLLCCTPEAGMYAAQSVAQLHQTGFPPWCESLHFRQLYIVLVIARSQLSWLFGLWEQWGGDT